MNNIINCELIFLLAIKEFKKLNINIKMRTMITFSVHLKWMLRNVDEDNDFTQL